LEGRRLGIGVICEAWSFPRKACPELVEGLDSDVDLLVVLDFDGKGFRKSLEILNRVDSDFSVDLVARCPEDTARRYEEGDPLIREALDHGKVLYERHR